MNTEKYNDNVLNLINFSDTCKHLSIVGSR